MDEDKNQDTPSDDEPEVTPEAEPAPDEPVETVADHIEANDNLEAPQQKVRKLPSLKMLIPVLAVVVLLIGGLVFVTGGDDESENSSETNTSDQDQVVNLASAVSLVEGAVQLSSDNQTWTDATGGETVNAGTYIRTLADSRTVLLHDDGSAIRLDSNSTVLLSVSDSNSVEVTLVSGQVYSRVVESDTRTYAVVTDRERFEALGTAFKTSTNQDTDEVEVYESSVKVDSDEATVEEGNKYDTESKDVTSIDFDKLNDDVFVQWNKDQDSQDEKFKNKLGVLNKVVEEEPEEKPEPTPLPAEEPKGSITISAKVKEDGIKVSWELSGVSSTDGYKVVRSKTSTTPTYKVDTSTYVSDPSATSKYIDVSDGKAYYFRVCIYRASSGTCDTYSNVVQITAPEKVIEPVVSGAVELTIDGSTISWAFDGTAPHGFKIVMNTNGDPVYPANSIKYVGAGTTSKALPEKPEGTYAVRICKYTSDPAISGGCVDYSNEVAYVVGGEEGGGEE